jgi:hypothetical protein
VATDRDGIRPLCDVEAVETMVSLTGDGGLGGGDVPVVTTVVRIEEFPEGVVTYPLWKSKFFGFLSFFSLRNRIPQIPTGLIQTLLSLNRTHMIGGYDHRPYRGGAHRLSRFRKSRCMYSPFSLVFRRAKIRNGSNRLTQLTTTQIKSGHSTLHTGGDAMTHIPKL